MSLPGQPRKDHSFGFSCISCSHGLHLVLNRDTGLFWVLRFDIERFDTAIISKSFAGLSKTLSPGLM